MRKTLPRLQRDFCMLWNKLVQEARNRGPYTTPVYILKLIRLPYIALHHDTDAAPTAFSPSTGFLHPILDRPSSYPLCSLASHRSGSTARNDIYITDTHTVPLPTQLGDSSNAPSPPPINSGSSVPQQADQANIIAGPSLQLNLATTSENGKTSEEPEDLSPLLPGNVSAVLHDTTFESAAILSRHPEGNNQQDIVAPGTEPDASTPPPVPASIPVPTSVPHVLDKFVFLPAGVRDISRQ